MLYHELHRYLLSFAYALFLPLDLTQTAKADVHEENNVEHGLSKASDFDTTG